MKATIFLVHLILSVSYPAALAAELLGVLPSRAPSFPAFIGFYVAAGVLAVVFLDYVRKPAQTGRRAVRRLSLPDNAVYPVARHAVNTWGRRTLSA